MREQEWPACTDPETMLEYLRGKASNRKNRLFACACGWQLLQSLTQTDVRSRQALEVGERFADGLSTEPQYLAACAEAQEAVMDAVTQQDFGLAAVRRDVRWAAEYGASVTEIARCIGDRAIACAIIHDIFGNPFRPVSVTPAWLAWSDGTILKLAQAIYDERHFQDLPILADALEEAGCTNADILAHCRGPGPHVRGCWVVDAILGKT
jgi:hypothetical protein